MLYATVGDELCLCSCCTMTFGMMLIIIVVIGGWSLIMAANTLPGRILLWLFQKRCA